MTADNMTINLIPEMQLGFGKAGGDESYRIIGYTEGYARSEVEDYYRAGNNMAGVTLNRNLNRFPDGILIGANGKGTVIARHQTQVYQGRDVLQSHYVFFSPSTFAKLNDCPFWLVALGLLPSMEYNRLPALPAFTPSLDAEQIGRASQLAILQGLLSTHEEKAAAFFDCLSVLLGSELPLTFVTFPREHIGKMGVALSLALPASIRRTLSFTTLFIDGSENAKGRIRFAYQPLPPIEKTARVDWDQSLVRMSSNAPLPINKYVEYLRQAYKLSGVSGLLDAFETEPKLAFIAPTPTSFTLPIPLGAAEPVSKSVEPVSTAADNQQFNQTLAPSALISIPAIAPDLQPNLLLNQLDEPLAVSQQSSGYSRREVIRSTLSPITLDDWITFANGANRWDEELFAKECVPLFNKYRDHSRSSFVPLADALINNGHTSTLAYLFRQLRAENSLAIWGLLDGLMKASIQGISIPDSVFNSAFLALVCTRGPEQNGRPYTKINALALKTFDPASPSPVVIYAPYLFNQDSNPSDTVMNVLNKGFFYDWIYTFASDEMSAADSDYNALVAVVHLLVWHLILKRQGVPEFRRQAQPQVRLFQNKAIDPTKFAKHLETFNIDLVLLTKQSVESVRSDVQTVFDGLMQSKPQISRASQRSSWSIF